MILLPWLERETGHILSTRFTPKSMVGMLNCKLGISWNTKEQSFLGVFLGGHDAIAKNLTLVVEKVNSVIKSWTFFSKGLSFIGRVLVVNSLCASKL